MHPFEQYASLCESNYIKLLWMSTWPKSISIRFVIKTPLHFINDRIFSPILNLHLVSRTIMLSPRNYMNVTRFCYRYQICLHEMKLLFLKIWPFHCGSDCDVGEPVVWMMFRELNFCDGHCIYNRKQKFYGFSVMYSGVLFSDCKHPATQSWKHVFPSLSVVKWCENPITSSTLNYFHLST